MRDFAKVSPLFWTRGSGKRLRGKPDAQIVALYLLTAPGANMIGVFYVPIVTIGHETGLGEARTLAALAVLEEVGFAHYDASGELAWVPNMAEIGIGERLKVADNRRAGVLAELERLRGHRFAAEFWRRYGDGYQLGDMPPELVSRLSEESAKGVGRGFEGVGPVAGHPLQVVEGGGGKRREGEEKERRGDPSEGVPSETTPLLEPVLVNGVGPCMPIHVEAPTVEVLRKSRGAASSKGTRLAEDWQPSPVTLERFATKERVDASACVERFKNHWIGLSGAKAVKVDWERTFVNWVLEDVARGKVPAYVAPIEPIELVEAPPATVEEAKAFAAKLNEGLAAVIAAQTPMFLRDEVGT
jgi:hypothetical protein